MIVGAASKVFESFGCHREIGTDRAADAALVFSANIGELQIRGCDLPHTRQDGLIDDVTVMQRPLSTVTVFAEKTERCHDASLTPRC